jgi:hypothetical protein
MDLEHCMLYVLAALREPLTHQPGEAESFGKEELSAGSG